MFFFLVFSFKLTKTIDIQYFVQWYCGDLLTLSLLRSKMQKIQQRSQKERERAGDFRQDFLLFIIFSISCLIEFITFAVVRNMRSGQ